MVPVPPFANPSNRAFPCFDHCGALPRLSFCKPFKIVRLSCCNPFRLFTSMFCLLLGASQNESPRARTGARPTRRSARRRAAGLCFLRFSFWVDLKESPKESNHSWGHSDFVTYRTHFRQGLSGFRFHLSSWNWRRTRFLIDCEVLQLKSERAHFFGCCFGSNIAMSKAWICCIPSRMDMIVRTGPPLDVSIQTTLSPAGKASTGAQKEILGFTHTHRQLVVIMPLLV